LSGLPTAQAADTTVTLACQGTATTTEDAKPEPRAMPAVARIFDGEKEAKLIALACSKPPKGRARWTLRLLENKVVELGIVDRASDSTIGRALKTSPLAPRYRSWWFGVGLELSYSTG
jgi:hypothetical protein